MLHARKQKGRFMGADHDCWLEMHIDEWDAELFSCKPSPKNGARCEEQIKLIGCAVALMNWLKEGRRAFTRKLKDHLRAMIKLPNAWVGNEAVKVLWLPEWTDLYASRLGGFFKNTGHDHRDAMPALFEHPAQPEKR